MCVASSQMEEVDVECYITLIVKTFFKHSVLQLKDEVYTDIHNVCNTVSQHSCPIFMYNYHSFRYKILVPYNYVACAVVRGLPIAKALANQIMYIACIVEYVTQWVVLSALKEAVPRGVLDYLLKQSSMKEIFKWFVIFTSTCLM